MTVLPPSVSADRFQTDYAASSRSTCKHCTEKIDKDELRVGKMGQQSNRESKPQRDADADRDMWIRGSFVCHCVSFRASAPLVQSQSFDGTVPNWHHLDCVFKVSPGQEQQESGPGTPLVCSLLTLSLCSMLILFAQATIIFSSALVDGIDNLRPEDQKTVSGRAPHDERKVRRGGPVRSLMFSCMPVLAGACFLPFFSSKI